MPTHEVDGLILTGDFDGGNLWHARAAHGAVELFPRPDCAGSEFVCNYRSWFNFRVKGAVRGRTVRFLVRYVNKQSNLEKFGHRVAYRATPRMSAWGHLPAGIIYSQDQSSYDDLPVELKR